MFWILFFVSFGVLSVLSDNLPNLRPEISKRTFQSPSIDSLIENLSPYFLDQNIATLFSNCLPNTLDTTVKFSSDSDSFIITGDIDALWLRDSGNQVIPYIPYATEDLKLQTLLIGLINRHASSILLDPFANSFNFNASGAGHQYDKRFPAMTPSIFEGKYEIDSLCAFLKISYWTYRSLGPDSLKRFVTPTWFGAISSLLVTIETMQRDTGLSPNPSYLFSRGTSEAMDTLMMNGRGPPTKPNGLSRSLFRPSDDAVTHGYHIPGNAMACTELRHLEEMLSLLGSEGELYLTRTRSIADPLCGSLLTLVQETSSSSQTRPLPYEIDGYGGEIRMDDANVPSLLSLPLLGYMSSSHPLYQTTRSFVLSDRNPFFFSGRAGEGIGGPHVGPDKIWPMSIIIRALTTEDDEEIKTCLDMLVRSSADTGFLHESFWSKDPAVYSRPWFAWVNGLFGELVLHLLDTKPYLLVDGNNSDVLSKVRALVKKPVSVLAMQETIVNGI